MPTNPIHERIKTDIEAAILSGALSPGARLPTEAEYMQLYDCSRMTVNKALSALMQKGLLDRRKRAGTFVAQPVLHSMILDVPDLAQEITRRGQSYAFELLRRRLRAPYPRDADEIDLADGGKLLSLEGVHLANNHPLAIERRLVSVAAIPAILDADLRQDAPGSWLLRHVPWTDAETRICAVPASSADSAALHIDPGAPCLRIDRRTWRGTQSVTIVNQTFRADLYDLKARFSSKQVMSDTAR